MDYKTALGVLRRIAEDEQNWRNGRQKIGELLQAAEDAERVLSTSRQQQTQLAADVAHLTSEKARLEQAVASVEKQLSRLNDDYEAKKKPLDERLAGLDHEIAQKLRVCSDDLKVREREKADRLDALDREIAAKEAQLHEAKKQLEEFRLKLTM